MKSFFFKNYIAFTVFLFMSVAACSQKNKSVEIPEVGTYVTMNLDAVNRYENEFNPRTGQLELRLKTNLEVAPSPFGRLEIKDNGTYEFLDLKKSGKYWYNEKIKKIEFSGHMEAATATFTISKGTCILLISTKNVQNGLHYEMKSKYPQPEVKNPNSIFSGIIITSLANNSVDYIDLENSKTINTFSYPSGNTKASFMGQTLHLESLYDMLSRRTDYPVVEIKDKRGNKITSYEGKSASGKAWQTGAYNYGVLSNDGAKFLLSGKLAERVGGTALYGYNEFNKSSYSVIDANNGNEIKTIVRNVGKLWTASWLPNGGLILPNNDGGIDITDANFSNARTVYSQLVSFAKCSPDGKQIIFQKGSQLFTIDINGSGEKQFTNNEVDLSFPNTAISDVCWSPDGEAIAIMMPDDYLKDKYYCLLVSTDGKNATMVKDRMGERLTFIRPFISWVSNDNRARAEQSTIQQTTVNDNRQTRPLEESNIGIKIKPNAYTIYEPTPQQANPAFTTAWELYSKVMEDDVENFHDVAAAITYVVSLNYMVLNHVNSISTSTTNKVYNQFVKNLLLDNNFKKLSNHDKQMMVGDIIMDGLETANIRNTNDPSKIKETCIRLMKKYIGKNAENMKITDNGMEF
jgi:hypothetical protein